MEISMREWAKTDADRVYELANNAKIARNLRDAFPYPYTFEDAKGYIKTCMSADPNSAWIRAVCLDGRVVGSIGVFRLGDVYRRAAEIGYWLGEPYWGQGIMTAAVQELCAHVFGHSDIVRIQAEIFAWNPASGRVLEKAGFSMEGIMRKKVFKDGQFVDGMMYALLKAE